MRMLAIRLSVLVAAAASPGVLAAQNAPTISGDSIKVGVVTDLSGVNLDYGGPTAVVAAQMAAEDLGGKIRGKPIKILALDHLNKADIASQKVREWFDQEGVGMVTELLNSGVALAVSKVAAEKQRIAMVIGSATTRLTNEDCNAYTVHYAFDTHALGYGTAKALMDLGGKTWFFITADFAFGHSLEKDTADIVKARGGQILGSVRHPAFQGVDFSSLILQAQASNADVIGLANSSNDTVNAIKAAHEFGVSKKQKLAALLMQISDIHALGLQLAQGLYFTDGWYWDLNEQTRAFARRFYERTQRMPGMVQAGTYSSTLQYLKAVNATGSDSADTVMAYMRKTKINDVFAQGGYIRDDGRMVHDMLLAQAKTPDQSKAPWDYYDIRAVIPGSESFIPLADSRCSLVK